MNSIILKSPAKLNLTLEVLSKRKDGYHNIRSVVAVIGLYDKIKISKNNSGRISINSASESIPLDEDNIAHKSALLMKKRFKLKCGFNIHIEKNIPVGGGFGGGSGNAATTLLGIKKLCGLKINGKQLNEVGAMLGSDVPLFFRRGFSIIEGRGEIITPLPSDMKLWFVIVDTGVPVSTKWAYGDLRSLTQKSNFSKMLCISILRRNLDGIVRSLFNEFENTVLLKHKKIRENKKILFSAAGNALLTGSGGGIFAVAGNRNRGRKIVGKLKEKGIESRLVSSI